MVVVRSLSPSLSLPLTDYGPVDFRKGCYLGQELTVRTYHTGATRKRILPIRLFPLDANPPTHPPPPGPLQTPDARPHPTADMDIMYRPPTHSASKKDRSAGRILALHPTVSNVGLGLVRLELAQRACWGDGSGEDNGRLTTKLGGREFGVWVGKGEAYGAALTEVASDLQAL